MVGGKVDHFCAFPHRLRKRVFTYPRKAIVHRDRLICTANIIDLIRAAEQEQPGGLDHPQIHLLDLFGDHLPGIFFGIGCRLEAHLIMQGIIG